MIDQAYAIAQCGIRVCWIHGIGEDGKCMIKWYHGSLAPPQ